MSRPRYIWWPYVKAIVRKYPLLCDKVQDLYTPACVANYSGMPSAHNASRTVESMAITTLTQTEMREYDAVRAAIEETKNMSSGAERLKVIKLVLWDKTHTIDGAALAIPTSYDSAQNWHGDFIRLVAKHYGLLE